MELGDAVEAALTAVGVTEEKVSKWLGEPCNCPERVEKLNNLSRWAKRVAKGKLDKAKEYLSDIMEQI